MKKNIRLLLVVIFITSCLFFGISSNAFSATISFNLELANPGVSIFRLKNTSPTAEITGFSVTIGDTDYNFDKVYDENTLIDPDGDLLAVLVTGDAVQGEIRTDLAEYSFTGFDPGDRFQFTTDIDLDGANTDELFNTVFFNNGDADNAVISVSFLAGSESGILSLTLEDDDTPDITNYFYDVSGETAPVPAPLSILLLGGGFLSLLGIRRVRKV